MSIHYRLKALKGDLIGQEVQARTAEAKVSVIDLGRPLEYIELDLSNALLNTQQAYIRELEEELVLLGWIPADPSAGPGYEIWRTAALEALRQSAKAFHEGRIA